MANEVSLMNISRQVYATMASSQHYAVKLNSSDQAVVCSTQGERPIGIVQDNPASGNCSIMVFGMSKCVLGGTVALYDPLTVASDGTLIKANDADEYVLGYALAAGVSGNTISMMITHSGSINVNASLESYISSGNYSSAGQYCAVKPHTTAGQIVKCSTAGEKAIGILQNAPAASAEAEVCTYGQCTGKAGTGGLSAGQAFTTASDGTLVAASGDYAVLGWAEAVIADGATGAVFFAGGSLMTATNLATTSSGDAAGDLIYRDAATTFERLAKGTALQNLRMNSGASAPEWASTVACADNVTTTSSGDAAGDLIYRDAATTFERLAKGSTGQLLAQSSGNAPEWIDQSAVAAGNIVTTAAGDAAGDLVYRDAAATFERLAKGTAGQILAMNAGASAPEWVSPGTDVTMAAGGAMTIANDVVTAAKMGSTAGGGSGIIFKGTNTANAVSELNVPVGNVVVGTTNDIAVLDMGAAAGNIMVDNGTAPASVAVSGDATLAADGALTIANDVLDGSNVAEVANANAVCGIPVAHRIDIADGAGNTDVVITYKLLVTDVVVYKTNGAGGAGDTVQVKNGTNAITDAIVLNIGDKAVARAGEIDDASNDIADGGTLRVAAGHNTDNTCTVIVYGLRIA